MSSRLMLRRTRSLRLAHCAVFAIAALSAGLSWRAEQRNTFTSYVPQTPPQRAQGDFDGDGRIDIAFVENATGTGRISIHLSGSPATVDLEPAVTGVVQSDVDHDGDLDLVAATPAGDLLIWINDGHGRFTRQPVSKTQGLSSDAVLVDAHWPDAATAGLKTPALPGWIEHDSQVASAAAGAMTLASVPCTPRTGLPPLRAPPATI